MHHINLPSEGPLTLTHLPSGERFFFPDRAAAARGLYQLGVHRLIGEPSAFFGMFNAQKGINLSCDSSWRLTNIYGEMLIFSDLPEYRPQKTNYGYCKSWEKGSHRSWPEPNIHRRTHGGRLRYPKTYRALREAAAEDSEAPVRAARRVSTIPSSWDDLMRGTQRSWKKHRRTQWKPVKQPRQN